MIRCPWSHCPDPPSQVDRLAELLATSRARAEGLEAALRAAEASRFTHPSLSRTVLTKAFWLRKPFVRKPFALRTLCNPTPPPSSRRYHVCPPCSGLITARAAPSPPPSY
jgi:hypothetical protein